MVAGLGRMSTQFDLMLRGNEELALHHYPMSKLVDP